MSLPLHKVNTLTGTKSAKEIDSAEEYAGIIKKAKRPLMVFGPKLTESSLGDKLLLDYALEIAQAVNMPICATAHIKGGMTEKGVSPDSEYDIVEIINALKKPDWKGVKGEGNHDLVLFFGIRTDLANQVQEMTLFYDTVGYQDGVVRRTVAEMDLRFVYRYEMVGLLEQAGFEVDAVHGSYDLDPYESDSGIMLFVAHTRA